MTLNSGQELYKKAKKLIPGGTQLFSKRPELFLPEQWPVYYKRAKGASIWDLDGRELVDVCSSGISACVLGYADPDVEVAVIEAIRSGQMTTLNCPEEIELAELLIEQHPWAEMVRYARSGGEIMAVAIRIARAATGREKIAFCGYHGWHDWYLAANISDDKTLDGHLLSGLDPTGVPRGLSGTMLPFRYNQIDDLEAIVSEYGDELAAIVMEPCRSAGPADGFLENVRELATKVGAALIFDEITSGWRLYPGGVHMSYGVYPDMCGFAKAMSNGYPMAAVVGKREFMEAAQDTFISSTYWTEKIGPTAALASMRKYRDNKVHEYQINVGERVKAGWLQAADSADIDIDINGLLPLLNFSFNHPHAQALATLFSQEMLDLGYLAAPKFNSTYSHDEKLLERYLQDVGRVFLVLAEAMRKDDISNRLRGPVRSGEFKRLT